METVVIYPGRFHPFHKGHKSVYDALVKRFGKNRVYIATSNKVDPPKSPFTFDEKRAMMALTGVDPSRVIQVKNPYQATEITNNYDPQNTIVMFAISEKDMAEDPRFSFQPKKDGSPSYYQPIQKDMESFDKHGYMITVPTLNFKVLGKPMKSATEFRANFARADTEKQQKMITDLFGAYDKRIHDLMATKISERLIRADEILERLIEIGADDRYIVEACARVDMLKNQVLKENRRQTLYQAIMEGGHSLPEREVAQEEITDFNKENPMNSTIAIRGIGTMSIGSALEKVSEMALNIAKLGEMKDAKNIQDNMGRYIDLLATYNTSIQEAYRELAQQRKRGGTVSRGIDKDISEDDITDRNKKALQKILMVKGIKDLQKKMPMQDDITVTDLDVNTPSIEDLIKKYGVSNEEMMTQVSKGVKHESEHTTDFNVALKIALDHISERFDYYDMLDKAEHMNEGIKEQTNEHCGDPMADEHGKDRALLYKLYRKGLNAVPGSKEHKEIVDMITDMRKRIGLDEAWSKKYKRSINCSNPKGFSQKAHCAGKKK